MYRDSKGLVTVGIGFLIEDHAHKVTEEGKKMPFVHRKNKSQRATEKEIEAEFEAVITQPYQGKTAASFTTTLELDEPYITERFSQLVTKFWGELHLELPDFDAYPMPVQYALLDMIFNLGRGTEWMDHGKTKRSGLHQYRELRKALDAGDWKKAGDSSHRKGIQDRRNQRIRTWFYAGASSSQPTSAKSPALP